MKTKLVELHVTGSPFPFMDKEQRIYTRASVADGIYCAACGIEIKAGAKNVFLDSDDNYYCPTETEIVQWSELWMAYEHPVLDCATKGIWYQITDGDPERGGNIRLMINNKESEHTRCIDMSWGSWVEFIRGCVLFDDLRRIKSGRASQQMIVVSPMDNDSFLVRR